MRIGYARVSARDQSPDLQTDALRAAGCARIFTEQASGAARDRKALTAALDHARPGDTLVVWKLDRLARSTRQLIETVENLQGRGVGFLCLTQDGLDTTTPGGRLIFQVFAAIAEFERETIRERTRAGLASARARGRVGGRPKALSADDLDMARVLLRSGDISVSAIARKLGVSTATLYRALPGGRSALF